MNKTRILFLDHNVDMAGGQKSLLALIDCIDRSRFELMAATPIAAAAFNEALSRRGVVRVDLGIGRRAHTAKKIISRMLDAMGDAIELLSSAFRIRKMCKRRDIDLIHANSIAAALIACIACMLTDVKTLIRVRSGLLYSNHGVIDLVILMLADVVLCNSIYVRDTIVERCAILPASLKGSILAKCKVIYNPLPWSAIKQARHKIRSGGKPSVLRKGRLNIGVVGRITERKQQHVAIEALKQLKGGTLPVHLWVIGDASPIDGGRYARDVQMRVKDYGLEDRVSFTGFINDIYSWLGGLDIVLMPSIAEPLARTIFEAQAMGTLVIAASDAGNAELIAHERTGMLFPAGDAKRLAECIDAASAEKYRQAMEWRALYSVARLFSPKRTVVRESDLLLATVKNKAKKKELVLAR